MQSAEINRVVVSVMVLTLLFFIVLNIVPSAPLIMFLNGIFFGAMVAVAFTYSQLIMSAVLGRRPYDRVRQMALGFACAWVALSISIAHSIIFYASGGTAVSTTMAALTRYLAIIAAVLQVTAPDFGFGLFHGAERRMLWMGIACGSALAVTIFILQALGQW